MRLAGIRIFAGSDVDTGPIQVALRVAEILDALGVPYLVGGAVASSILGEPRARTGMAGGIPTIGRTSKF